MREGFRDARSRDDVLGGLLPVAGSSPDSPLRGQRPFRMVRKPPSYDDLRCWFANQGSTSVAPPTAACSSSTNLSLSTVPVFEHGAAGRERRPHDGPSPAGGHSAVIRLAAAGSTHARVIRIRARRFLHFSIFTSSCCGRSLIRVSPSADSASASELNSEGFVPGR